MSNIFYLKYKIFKNKIKFKTKYIKKIWTKGLLYFFRSIKNFFNLKLIINTELYFF